MEFATSDLRRELELAGVDDRWPVVEGKSRLLLVAINVPNYYSLPVRILSLVAGSSAELRDKFDTRYVEVDVKQEFPGALGDAIERWRPDIAALSLNIWNRNAQIKLAGHIKEKLPATAVIVGGQEATNSIYNYLDAVEDFDYVVDGEAEIPFRQFLTTWNREAGSPDDAGSVSGLHYRQAGVPRFTGPGHVVTSLDDVPSPILAGLVPAKSKQALGILLEGSRGCPMQCSFCFEGKKGVKVRSASVEKLEKEALHMASMGAVCFHMLDPNLNLGGRDRIEKLSGFFRRLVATNPATYILTEVYAHQISERTLECLKACSIIDIGLQTTNPATAKAINRPFNERKFLRGINYLHQIKSSFNLYLICGLPEETMATFLEGIRFIIAQRPTRIFFNELCLLNGTELRYRAKEYGYEFDTNPPYQVSASRWMSKNQMAVTIALAKVVERQFNLTMRAVFPGAPWVLERSGRAGGADGRIRLQTGCSRGCHGCANISPGPAPDDGRLDELLQTGDDMDVELVCGDMMNIEQMFRLMSQLQLAGVARIKLTGPLRNFADSAEVKNILSRGIWHFKTFLGDDDNLERAGKCLENIKITYSLIGQALVRPMLEVVLVGEAMTAARAKKLVDVAVPYANFITVPPEMVDDVEEWARALAPAFEEMIFKRKAWLKLPEKLMSVMLENTCEWEEVKEHFRSLGLVSYEKNMNPCLVTSFGEEVRVMADTRAEAVGR